MPAHRFSNGFLTASISEVFRADKEMVVTAFVICNTSGSNRTYEIQHVPADESASDEHCLYHSQQVRTGINQTVETAIYLNPGDSIHAAASVGGDVAFSAYVMDYSSYISKRGTS